jgi:hypothetical protein
VAKARGWQREFDDPIDLPDGETAHHASRCRRLHTALPKKASALPEWQAAIEVLLLVSCGGPTMMAGGGLSSIGHFNSEIVDPSTRAQLLDQPSRLLAASGPSL